MSRQLVINLPDDEHDPIDSGLKAILERYEFNLLKWEDDGGYLTINLLQNNGPIPCFDFLPTMKTRKRKK